MNHENVLNEMALHAQNPKFVVNFDNKWVFRFDVKSSNKKELFRVYIDNDCDDYTHYIAHIHTFEDNSKNEIYDIPIYTPTVNDIIARALNTNNCRNTLAFEESCLNGSLKEFVKK